MSAATVNLEPVTDRTWSCQKRGWCIVAVHPNAIAESRELKPSIPKVGNDGIPIRDEIELEYSLCAAL